MAAQLKPTIIQRSLAEALGTFLLVFIGAGTGAGVNILLNNLNAKNGGYAPLINAPAEANLLIIALAHGLALLIAVYTIGKISGAHVNPAVTIGLLAVKKITWKDALYYIVAQLIGATLGALAIVAVLGHTQAIPAGLGATTYTDSTPAIRALVAEAGGAFILVFAIMGTAVDKRAPDGWAGLVIGFALAAAIMVCGPVSGASVNPARTFGPDLILFFFKGASYWGQYWVYVVGPIAGGVVAALLYRFITHYDLAERVERPAPQREKVATGPVAAAKPAVKPKR